MADPLGSGPLVTVRLGPSGHPVAPDLFGSNELGTMDGAEPSASFDRKLRVPFRRLGGNLMTPYNWVNNASNSGQDWKHENSFVLPDLLGLSAEARREPAAVITAMHASSLGMGAKSLVTLPLAGFVAADGNGPVGADEAAPSPRFVPVTWTSERTADDPLDPAVADIPQLLRRLVARYGRSGTATGIFAYALDNEPGLWAQTHPRIVRTPVTIRSLLDRSIAAAEVIRTVDPGARIFGPAGWGVTGFQTLQNAPDWHDYSATYDSFLSAYLDAFRQASERFGARLLDALDIHWYPQSRKGELFRTVDPRLAEALLAAPRSLTDPDFREDSWVTRSLRVRTTGGLSLPLLPSLQRLVDRWFPGTRLAVTEFNFGGPSALVSGLAVADALGRMAQSGVAFACHWGNLEGWIGEAYRLYLNHDGKGGRFSGNSIPVATDHPDRVAVHGARDGTRLMLVLINKSEAPLSVRLPGDGRIGSLSGFDADHPTCGPLPVPADPAAPLILPPRAARLAVLA